MKLLTAGGLLFSAVTAQTDTADSQGMEGAYELFDYVLTVNAGEISSSLTALTGIGYNPVTTAIVVGNDGGKLIVGYGMQTKTIAIGFVMAYMTAGSTINCTVAAAAITGYNTLVPRNMAGDTSNVSVTATTPAACATNTTWVYQTSRSAAPDTNCQGYSCIGVSQPLFGLAEDWAFGTGAAPVVAEYYALGAIEFNCDETLANIALCRNKYGNGAYEVRVVKLSIVGLSVWDNGHGAAESTLRSNCSIPVTVIGANATPLTCVREAAHSAFLTGRMSDNNPNAGGVANTGRFLMIGGVAITTQNPLMYKNGWQFTIGIPLLYRIIFTGTSAITAVTFVVGLPATTDHAPSLAWSPGAFTKLVLDLSNDKINTTTADGQGRPNIYGIKPGSENSPSFIQPCLNFVGVGGGDWGATCNTPPPASPVADFGTVIDCYGFQSGAGGALLTSTIDQLMCVGEKLGAGYIFNVTTAAPQTPVVANTYLAATMGTLVVPKGGIVNFKGVASTPTYVNQVCTSIAPHYATTNVVVDGWVFQCRNGIQECDRVMNSALAAPPSITALTSSATTSDTCYADQRYMNYRVQTFYYTYPTVGTAATFSWSRQDSYWESTATAYMNTGSPGVVLDASLSLDLTANQRTYVFPTYNCMDGIQLNHFSTAGTNINPATYVAVGAGTNNLTSAPASYSSTDWCMSSNLKLEGITDTSSLAAAVTAYSDGYKATSTLSLETFLGGALGSWKGYCMVYYSSQYVLDNTNGSICHVAVQAADNVYGVASQYLMHVPSGTWAPPASSGAVSPSSLALTDAKYSVTYDPTSSIADIYYAGHYTSVWWYQPKYASSYTLVARYGKSNYVGAYCMMGSTSTSWFIPPASGTVLTGSVALAAGAVVLGSAILAM